MIFQAWACLRRRIGRKHQQSLNYVYMPIRRDNPRYRNKGSCVHRPQVTVTSRTVQNWHNPYTSVAYYILTTMDMVSAIEQNQPMQRHYSPKHLNSYWHW